MAMFQNGQLAVADLHVNQQELGLLYQLLDEVPGKVGRRLFNKIEQQVKDQIDAHQKTLAEDNARSATELRNKHRQELLDEQKKSTDATSASAPPDLRVVGP